MNALLETLSAEMTDAFKRAGYESENAAVRESSRPDLCEFQCNAAMAAAKKYHTAPLLIAQAVAEALRESSVFSEVTAAAPGFINLSVAPAALKENLRVMAADPFCGIPQEKKQKILIDYGGPNVAKPLHIGHLRSAVIGESIKRLARGVGHDAVGDIHLGDWGLQMGLLIAALEDTWPELPYFNEGCVTDFPEEVPFAIGDLERLYPEASAKSKEDEAFRERAMRCTHLLQEGHPGYRALWKKIMELSIADLRKNYEKLNVEFDLWKGESDVQDLIAPMTEDLVAHGIARYDEGALIVDVSEETDKKEIPPCIVLKSDGAALYSTTDLATLIDRRRYMDPDRVIYVVDKRQDMHFTQVFRAARRAGIVREDTGLSFLGFGTMNGKDGKPFKTREGGVMRLEYLIRDIDTEMEKKIRENRNIREEDAAETARIVGLAALKYGDLSNQATKDYVFDIEKFTSFEGNTGPYILYTIVRIGSILEKAGIPAPDVREAGEKLSADAEGAEKKLMLCLTGFGSAVKGAFDELAPHRLCQYIYELANAFNAFYHETRILTEEDPVKKEGYLSLLVLVREVLERSISLLGFSAPAHM